MASIATVALY